VRSTKTVNSLLKFSHWVKNEAPFGGDLLFSGKTRDTIKRNILYPLRRYVGKKNCKFSIVNGEGVLYGRTFHIVGAYDESSEERVRGITLAGAYIDEVTIIPESFYRMVLSRLSLEGARLYGTTNPDSPYHWLKIEIDKNLDSMISFHFTLDDNPYLPQRYKDDLKAEYGEGTLYYRRFYLGEWCLAEGAIYDMWDERKHVIDTPPFTPKTWYVGIDYGTHNPTCFLMVAIDGGQVYCAKEYYYDSVKKNKSKSDAEYAADLVDFVGDTKVTSVIVDPSALSFKVALRACNLTTRDAHNSVLDGIRTTARLLTADKLHVNKSCENLIMEFSSYVWDERSQIIGEDRPMKANDHACDALRYICHTVLGKGESRAITF